MLYGFVDDAGEVLLLKEVDFSRQGVGSIVGCDGATCLEQGSSAVVVMVDDVDGDAAFVFAGGHDGLMHMVAVHTSSAVLGQQGGVDVDNAVGVGVEHRFGDQPEETRQDDPVDVFALQVLEYVAVVVEIGTAEVSGLDTKVFGPLGDVGVTLIIYDTRDFDIGATCEVFADLLSVGAIAGAKDGQSDGSVHGRQICIDSECKGT